MSMNYDQFFADKVAALKAEGNYRVFADLEREAGNFPTAKNYQANGTANITVWCSNDYLGMGQNPVVMNAMHEALDKCGAGAGGKGRGVHRADRPLTMRSAARFTPKVRRKSRTPTANRAW